MRLTLDALLALDAIASEGSFAKAAEVLHKVPSALTYTMQKLESDLEVSLFDRSGKRAVLTPVGRLLLEQGRDLLRQAEAVERRIKRLGEGWEAQLVIAVDNLVPLRWLFPLIREFDALGCGTRLKLGQEILGGGWDALIDRRADLVVGAPGEAPSGHGLVSRDWLQIDAFVFAVAPSHPLAQATEPLSRRELSRHRAVVVADSSRRLAARTMNLQPAQETLHVPNLETKIEAQVAGLGVGFLPSHMAAGYVASGALRVMVVEDAGSPSALKLAWRAGEEGRALAWFRDRILSAGRENGAPF